MNFYKIKMFNGDNIEKKMYLKVLMEQGTHLIMKKNIR